MCQKGRKCSETKHCKCKEVQCYITTINKTPIHITHHKCIRKEIINPPIVKHIYYNERNDNTIRDVTKTKHRSKKYTNKNSSNKCTEIDIETKTDQESSSSYNFDCSKYLCIKKQCINNDPNCKYIKKYNESDDIFTISSLEIYDSDYNKKCKSRSERKIKKCKKNVFLKKK